MNLVAPDAGSEIAWGLAGMTPAAWALLGSALLLACGDWWSVSGLAPRAARLEYLFKPATLVAILGVAVTLHPAVATERDWFVVAFVLCLGGDVLLMLPSHYSAAFGAGLGSFLLAHCCFIAGLVAAGARLETTLLALCLLVAASVVPGLAVLRGILSGHRPLAGPVILYMAALLTMGAMACSVGFAGGLRGDNPVLVVGALFFVVSDTLLALNRFAHPLVRASLLVHATYHVAVALLVLSLAGAAAIPS